MMQSIVCNPWLQKLILAEILLIVQATCWKISQKPMLGAQASGFSFHLLRLHLPSCFFKGDIIASFLFSESTCKNKVWLLLMLLSIPTFTTSFEKYVQRTLTENLFRTETCHSFSEPTDKLTLPTLFRAEHFSEI